MDKSKLRKKILKIRINKNKDNIKIESNKIFNLIKKVMPNKKIVGGYFPVNYEIDDLSILRELHKKKYQISLPVIKKNFTMDFYKWHHKDPLIINSHGIPEPRTSNLVYPDIILVPLVAFDQYLNRLGYGGGYYDRLIEKQKKKKNILKIGLALSVQMIDKIPISKYDKKLDYIVTENFIL